uniref:Uncharacterized protein n=1 Tax=Fundulus heteroclitus TaxID=8078 RepID=A0A146R1L5_FUNHE
MHPSPESNHKNQEISTDSGNDLATEHSKNEPEGGEKVIIFAAAAAADNKEMPDGEPEVAGITGGLLDEDEDFNKAADQFEEEVVRDLRETESQMEQCEAFMEEEEQRVNGTPAAGVYWTLWVPGHGYVTDEEYVRITGDTRYVENPLPTGLPPTEDTANQPNLHNQSNEGAKPEHSSKDDEQNSHQPQ